MRKSSLSAGSFVAASVLLIGCGQGASGTGAPTATSSAVPGPSTVTATATASATASATATAAATAAPTADPKTAPGERSCEAPPKGMVCIPGGKAIIGSDKDLPSEKPRHEVLVSTFYIDKYEVTNADYETCEKAGKCRPRATIPDFKPYLAPELPATPVSWSRAREFCRFVGKRLPTEAEWEKAARGGAEARTYPWGEDEPTCDKAQFQGCEPNMTKKGGSFAPGPYGIFDMAGNGYEWVEDYGTNCYQGCFKECGDECMGRDPAGPCGGAPDCPGRNTRVLKGGSWWWTKEHMRGSHRRMEPAEDPHRFSVRCAASRPDLATWPPLAITDPLPRAEHPPKPTAEQLAAFRDVVQDDDVLKLPICAKQGMPPVGCKDPNTYFASNEFEQFVWQPYLKNRGGGYVGVGATQGYTFIAEARSEWVWLLDYDPDIPRLHAFLHALIAKSPSRAEFMKRFEASDESASAAIIEEALKDHPEKAQIVALYKRVRTVLLRVYQTEIAPNPQFGTFGWLRAEENYEHIRWLVLEGRIQSVRGNLLTDKTVPSFGRSAKKLGVPIRVYYPSNADDLWELTKTYRDNFRSLPMDDKSIAIRTISGRSKQEPTWTYMVHHGLDEQEKLGRNIKLISTFLYEGHAPEKLLRVVGMPARTPREAPEDAPKSPTK